MALDSLPMRLSLICAGLVGIVAGLLAEAQRGAPMSSAIGWWVVIVVVGALNYLSRLSFIALFAKVEMPPLVARALRFVPAAMLTAIVVPAVVFSAPGTLAFTLHESEARRGAGGGRRRLAHEERGGDDGRSACSTLWLAQWLLAARRARA